MESGSHTQRGDGKGLEMPSESDQALAARDEGPERGPTGFSVRPERYDDVYLLTVSGELDLASHQALNDELERAETSEAKRILLDLSRVTFIDSTGICLLVQAHRRSAENGRRLRLLPVSGHVRDVLELTGLVDYLDFAVSQRDRVDAAVHGSAS